MLSNFRCVNISRTYPSEYIGSSVADTFRFQITVQTPTQSARRPQDMIYFLKALTKTFPLIHLPKTREHPEGAIPGTFQTFDQSNEATWPVQKKPLKIYLPQRFIDNLKCLWWPLIRGMLISSKLKYSIPVVYIDPKKKDQSSTEL